MKTCKGCKHAIWHRTVAGKLHQSGKGVCGYEYAVPKLPASRHWGGSGAPFPYGGVINRHEELKEHCVYWTREAGAPTA